MTLLTAAVRYISSVFKWFLRKICLESIVDFVLDDTSMRVETNETTKQDKLNDSVWVSKVQK